MTSVDPIVRAAVAGDDIVELFERYRYESGESFAAAMARAMVAVAEGFLGGLLSYPDADQAANRLYSLMLFPGGTGSDSLAEVKVETFPPLAWEIFAAFDHGEYHHGNGLDPIEHYTIPLLRSALGKRDQPRDGR